MFSMRKHYYTEYYLPHPDLAKGARYSSYLLAHNREEAEALIKVRGLGEEIQSEQVIHSRFIVPFRVMTRPDHRFERDVLGKEVRTRSLIDLLHQVHFLQGLGETSGRFPVETGLFGDQGPLHELVHMFDMPDYELSNLDTLKLWLKRLSDSSPELFYTSQEIIYLDQQELAVPEQRCDGNG